MFQGTSLKHHPLSQFHTQLNRDRHRGNHLLGRARRCPIPERDLDKSGANHSVVSVGPRMMTRPWLVYKTPLVRLRKEHISKLGALGDDSLEVARLLEPEVVIDKVVKESVQSVCQTRGLRRHSCRRYWKGCSLAAGGV